MASRIPRRNGADVRRMPVEKWTSVGRANPLTQPQLNHLAKRLREERKRVLRVIERYYERLASTEQDATGDLSNAPLHLADEGMRTFDLELDALQASRFSVELNEIDAALERLYREPQRFGRDERTGDDIPFERLDVIPWARTCVARLPHIDAPMATPDERVA